MKRASLVGMLLCVPAIFAQEPVVSRSKIWVETVQHGDLPVGLRATGVLSGNRAVELNVPADEAKRIEPGQPASIDIQRTSVQGSVVRVGPNVSNGLVTVLVDLQGRVPDPVRPHQPVSGVIQVTVLNGVTHVGRPVACAPGGEGVLFKVSADGGSATKVKVRYGQASLNRVEISSGLQPGDKVILSDMSAYNRDERVLLR